MENKLAYEVELQPGEKLSLPQGLVDRVGAGHWRITIEPVNATSPLSVRSHDAFLHSYAPEDEGLYDDYSPR